MITPDYPSGHEVTRPIYVEGAEAGDAIAIKIRKINVLSLATTSGTDEPVRDILGDPFVAKRCPICGEINPATYIEGIGADAIRCSKCKEPVTPFRMSCGYTILMDEERRVGVTVPQDVAEEIALDAAAFSTLPKESRQYSANVLARGDVPGLIAPLKPWWECGHLSGC